MSAIHPESRQLAIEVAQTGLKSSDAATRVRAAAAVAQFELADVTLAASRPAGNDRACVETIKRAVRVSWPSAQQELDAVYEALRQYGHSI